MLEIIYINNMDFFLHMNLLFAGHINKFVNSNEKDPNHQRRMKLSGLILILGLIVCILKNCESTNKQYAKRDIKEQRLMLAKHHLKNRLYHLFHQIIVSQFFGKRLKKRDRYILRPHLFLWNKKEIFERKKLHLYITFMRWNFKINLKDMCNLILYGLSFELEHWHTYINNI